MLCDRTIRKLLDSGKIGVDPLPTDECIQPASIDLRLGEWFISPWPQRLRFKLPAGEGVDVRPGECLLASTAETVRVPRDLIARVEGKSTFGRLFLQVHSTAGFIDPGFEGQITLELSNQGRSHLNLIVGAPICQISFEWLDGPADRPYGSAGINSHYQHQYGPTEASRLPSVEVIPL